MATPNYENFQNFLIGSGSPYCPDSKSGLIFALSQLGASPQGPKVGRPRKTREISGRPHEVHEWPGPKVRHGIWSYTSQFLGPSAKTWNLGRFLPQRSKTLVSTFYPPNLGLSAPTFFAFRAPVRATSELSKKIKQIWNPWTKGFLMICHLP